MVIMANGIARERVRTTTATTTTTAELLNTAAILQKRDSLEYFFDIGHPYSNQLTPVKTRYPLTSIT